MKKLSVIIVLYDEYKIVLDCLKSVYQTAIKNKEVFLVQNNSGKPGVESVLKKYPKLIYIKNKGNLGFGQAANVGIKKATGEYIIVLTPDTVLVKDTIENTLQFIQKHPDVGLVGCRVYEKPKRFQGSAFYEFPNLITHLYEYNMLFYKLVKKIRQDFIPTMYSIEAHRKEIYAKHIGGAYLLFRAKALRSIGGFSNRYFLYREETDVCKRLDQKGWDIVYLPVGGVIHSGEGETRIRITQASPHYLKSTYTFFKTYHGLPYAFFAWLLGLLSAALTIPFLAGTSTIKKMAHKKSQSSELLPYWIMIFKWHLTKGLGALVGK